MEWDWDIAKKEKVDVSFLLLCDLPEAGRPSFRNVVSELFTKIRGLCSSRKQYVLLLSGLCTCFPRNDSDLLKDVIDGFFQKSSEDGIVFLRTMFSYPYLEGLFKPVLPFMGNDSKFTQQMYKTVLLALLECIVWQKNIEQSQLVPAGVGAVEKAIQAPEVPVAQDGLVQLLEDPKFQKTPPYHPARFFSSHKRPRTDSGRSTHNMGSYTARSGQSLEFPSSSVGQEELDYKAYP